MAGDDLDLGFGDVQAFGQEFDAHPVGGVIHGRSGELDFECIMVRAHDHVFG